MSKKFGFILAICAIVGWASAIDALAQSLRVKITTNELLHYGVSYCLGDETSISVGGVKVMLGPNAVTTATTYPPGNGYAYVTVPPGEYSITISGPIDKGNAEIAKVYLEGRTIYQYPPDVRKGSTGVYYVNLTSERAKQPLGSGEWDYWIAIMICFGEASATEEGPEITAVTLPGSLAVGQRQPYDVDFRNAKGGANSVSIVKRLLNPHNNEWFDVGSEEFSAAGKGVGTEESGSFPLTALCSAVTKTEGKLVYTLKDNAGRISKPYEVEFRCTGSGSPPAPGTGAASGWTGLWDSASLGRMTIYQVEGNRLTGSFSGVAVASGVAATALGALRPGVVDGTVSSDGMTFSGNWYELPTASGPASKGTFSLTRNASGSSLNGTFSSGGQSQNVSANRQGTTPIPGGQAPRITDLQYPDMLPVGMAVNWKIFYSDADGDITRLVIEERIADSWTVTLDTDLKIQGKTTGSINMTLTCRRTGVVQKRATLYDASGNSSVATEYTLNCVNATVVGNPPPPPTGGITSLKSFDTNNNDLIDDPEFFAIIDAWIAEQIDDPTFFKAMDLWVSQSSISSAALRSQPFRLGTVTLASHSGRSITFIAHGQGITAMAVEVFDLSGTRIFQQELAGTQLTWNLHKSDGRFVSNGVYLYAATVRALDGRALRSDVKKLVILR